MNIFELFGKIGIHNKEANQAIDETTGKAERAHGKLSAVFGKIGQVAVKAGKIMATGLAVGVTALAGLTGAATKHYAEYEQLVGGIETLFGAGGKSLEEYAQSVGKSVDEASAEYENLMSAQEDLLSKSKIAYKTAGLSANQYMETATSFSASLIQSVGGDTVKAAKLADQAIIDMADNANKMGSSMESIQNAYQGFAKQNYTMLDNLKLGYGGTKEEMQRLLDDAEKISGIKYDISSFADVTEAIHVMQEEMGIAGTTSKEAASTISGSVGMLKAAWENFLTGMADPDQDFGELVNGLTESIGIALGNIVPRLVEALPRLIQGLSQVIQTLAGYLPEILSALLPGLITGATELISALGSTLPDLFLILFDEVLPQVSEAFVTFLEKVFKVPEGSFSGLTEGLNLAFATVSSVFDVLFGSMSEKDNIDLLTKMGMDPGTAETIITTATEIGDTVKTAFETAVDLFSEASEKIGEFIDWVQKGGPEVDALKTAVVAITTALGTYLVISKAIATYEAIKNGVVKAGIAIQAAYNAVMSANPIMVIIIAITALVATLVYFFTQTETGKKIWQGFVDFLGNAWNIISTSVQTAWTAITEFLSGLWNGIVSAAQGYFNFLVEFYSGIWSAISGTVSSVWNGIVSFLTGLWDGIVNTASTIFNTVKDTVTGVFEDISGTASRIWDGIKNAISTAIDGAKDAVSRAIDKIKGFFDFKITWPKIPMPRFSVNPSGWQIGDLLKGKIPSLAVDFYAKGGIMTGPTMFGINGNRAMVGGEAGEEAILPLNSKNLAGVGHGIAEASGFGNDEIMAVLFEILSTLKAIQAKDGNVYIDSDKLIGHIWKRLRDKFAFEDNVDLIFRRGT